MFTKKTPDVVLLTTTKSLVIKDESVKGNNSAHTAELSPQKYAARTILTAYLAKQESGFPIYHQNSSCTFIVFNHSNQFI